MAGDGGPSFILFSSAHLGAVVVITFTICLLYLLKKVSIENTQRTRMVERFFALSLLAMEAFYHIWLISMERWSFSNSMPLELCSISLLVAIVLLWTGNRRLIDFVFYAGIGGALQALVTPVLDLSYPHFRYFSLFLCTWRNYTHSALFCMDEGVYAYF